MIDSPIALVTGAGGFIGGHLVDQLINEGYRVHAVDKKPTDRWHQVHPDAKSTGNCLVRIMPRPWIEVADEIYHLAADMGGIGFTALNDAACGLNILDTANILQGMTDGQKIFYSSTACVYPTYLQAVPGNIALRESDVWPYDPDALYGFEKLYAEKLIEAFDHEHGIDSHIARYHNVYGSYGDWNTGREKAPAAICRKIAIAKITGNYEIEVWGDGEQSRSFMYIDDCIYGTRLIMDKDECRNRPVNLGSDQWVTINQLVSITAEIAGLKKEITVKHDLSKPQGVRGRNSDNTLIKELLDWTPEWGLTEGLEITYRWIYDQVKKDIDESATALPQQVEHHP